MKNTLNYLNAKIQCSQKNHVILSYAVLFFWAETMDYKLISHLYDSPSKSCQVLKCCPNSIKLMSWKSLPHGRHFGMADTRVSFVRKSREFLTKRVSYFAKNCFSFREIPCFSGQNPCFSGENPWISAKIRSCKSFCYRGSKFSRSKF